MTRMRSYLSDYLAERQLESARWNVSNGTFRAIANRQLVGGVPDLFVRLAPPDPAAHSTGGLKLSPIAVPLEHLAIEALGGLETNELAIYVHEPYLTRDDEIPLVEPLMEISGRLYARVLCRETSAPALAEFLGMYFVTWSFVMIRSAGEVCDADDLFGRADMIAVAAFAGEGFVIWNRDRRSQ